MGLIFPDPPTPPNPILTAGAQTAQNIGTGITGSYLNNYNQVTPQGNLSYDTTSRPSYNYTDPLTGQVYQVPQWTATQTLSPMQQTLQGLGDASRYNQAELGKDLSYNLWKTLGPDNTLHDTYNRAPYAGGLSWLQTAQPAKSGWEDVGGQQRNVGDPGQQQSTFADTGGPAGTFGDAGAIQNQIGGVPGQQYGFDQAGDLTRSYGPADNFSADRQRVEQSLFQRMDPQLQQDRERLRQQLADQGIQYGTEAYDRAIAAADRQTTDARLAVTAAGGAEQQRMNDMAAQRAGFENAAQQQAYNQAMGRGQFYNTAQQATFGQEQARGTFANAAQRQAYEEAQGRGTFANAAQKQAYEQALGRGTFANQAQLDQFQKNLQAGNFANQAQKDTFTQAASRAQFYNAAQAQELARNNTIFGAQNQLRNQYLTEQAALRNQPINEIAALQSGSQIQQPNFVSGGNSQIANTDVAGIINANFGQQLDIYKQQSGNVNNIIGGLFGLAGSGARAYGQMNTPQSDRRVKKNVARVGTVYAAKRHDEPKKLPIYSYEYKDGHEDSGAARHIGPMAQDVEKIDPGAVIKKDGIRHIKAKRVIGDILRVA